MKTSKKSGNFLQRWLALLLAVMLLVGGLPMEAFAADMSSDSSEAIVLSEVGDSSADPADGDESTPAPEVIIDIPDESEPETGEEPTVPDEDIADAPDADTSEEEREQIVPPSVTPSPQSDVEEEVPEEEDTFDPNAPSGAGTGGESEDVAVTETEDTTLVTDSGDSEVGITSERGVEITYAADGVTTFSRDALAAGEVWVDKSVTKTDASETSFEETLSAYSKRFTSTSDYATGNYVLVVDVTHSIYNADTSGALFVAMTKAINDLAVEICKNPLSNVSVIAYSADKNSNSKNKNAYATSVILGMGNWNKAGTSLLTADISNASEYSWFIGPTAKASSSGVASTGKRYLSKGTFTQAGIAHAASILKAQTDKANTTGYIILFTDGVPTFATTSWAAGYDASAAQWASGSSYSIGTGDYVPSEGYAYTLLTMQYWRNYLKGQYKNCYLYAGHFSNDTYNSNVEKVGKWVSGVRNSVTYTATDSASTNADGYYGSMVSSGYPNNRIAATFAGYTADKDYQSVSNGVKKLKSLLTAANLTKLGLTDADTFNAPCIAQFCSLSAYDSAAKKKAALSHLISNLENSVKKDKITQGGLKAGTNVVFTSTTGVGMKVSTVPMLSYRNVKYQPASTSGNDASGYTYTYNSDYTYNGVTTKVTGTVKVQPGTQNNSVVTVTMPANLVNEAGMANSAYPTRCIFGVDLYSTDYPAVCDLYGEKFTTYTNEYSSSQTKATFTTAADNPFYATTGTAKVNKAQNSTKTLAYVSSTVKGKSGTQSTATLGNNGRIDMELIGGAVEILVWEINQADQTTILPNIPYHVEDASGNRVTLDGKPLSFTSTDKVITIEGVPPGEYSIVADSVPDGYVMPEPVPMIVRETTSTQHFDVYIPTILIDVWAVDKITGETVDGVVVNICDRCGEIIYENIPLEFVQEYVPAGDYTIMVVSVPERYILPEDTMITVESIREKQDFVIPLEHLGSITIKKFDADHKPLAGVSFDLLDASGNILMSKTTDKNGVAVFADDASLVPGEYTITETKTNAGLSLLKESIHVTLPVVMTDVEVQAQNADTSKGWYSATEKKWYFYDVSYEISNTSNFNIPMTGGQPNLVWLFGCAGFLCIASAGAYLYLISRKRA